MMFVDSRYRTDRESTRPLRWLNSPRSSPRPSLAGWPRRRPTPRSRHPRRGRQPRRPRRWMMLSLLFLSLLRSLSLVCVTCVSEWSTCFLGCLLSFSLPSVVICFRQLFLIFLLYLFFYHIGDCFWDIILSVILSFWTVFVGFWDGVLRWIFTGTAFFFSFYFCYVFIMELSALVQQGSKYWMNGFSMF